MLPARRCLTGPITAVLLLLAAAPALASPTSVTITASKLTVVGDGSGESYAVAYDYNATPDTYTVSGPSGFGAAPAGCSSTSTSVTCPAPTVNGISLDTAGGADTIDEKSVYPIVFLFFGGGEGPVIVNGGPGNDTLNAVNTPLTFIETGGADDDTLNGVTGIGDFFQSEAGNDTYRGDVAPTPAGASVGFPVPLSALAGDFFRYQGSTGVNVSLDNVRNDSDGLGGTDDVGADIEQFFGTDGDDTFTAGSGAFIVSAGPGNDTVTGSPQDDRILGSEGNDTLSGGAGDDDISDGDVADSYVDTTATPPPDGNDTLDGGDGDDTLSESLGHDDVHGGAGEDTVVAGRFHQQVVDTSVPGFTPPENMYEPLTIRLDDQANDGATGSSEADNIHADVENVDSSLDDFNRDIASNDVITATGAANQVISGGGADTIDPGAGPDVVEAGRGDDHVTALDKAPDDIVCAAGADTVSADLPGGDPANADALTDCETVNGTALPPAQVGVPPNGPSTHIPTFKLSGARTVKTSKFLKSRVLAIGISANQPYSATGEAIATGARIAKLGELTIGSGKLARGTGKRILRVKVAKSYATVLKRQLRTRKQRRRGVRIPVVVTVTGAAGRSASARRTFRVKG